MLRGAIAAFAKTPGRSPVKTRLAASVGADAAEQLYRLSCSLTEHLLLNCESSPHNGYTLQAHWAVAEEAGLADPLWSALPVISQTPERPEAALLQIEFGLGMRLSHVYRMLLEKYDFVILIGCDSPQLSPETVKLCAQQLASSITTELQSIVIGPAEDGGFYLLGSHLPIAERIWTNVQYSRSDTLSVLLKLLNPIGTQSLLATETDLDTIEDAVRIAECLRRRMSEGGDEVFCMRAEQFCRLVEQLS